MQEGNVMDKAVMAPGTRWTVRTGQGAAVLEGPAADSATLCHVPAGAVVVCAQATLDPKGEQQVRISSPAGWMNTTDLEPAPALLPAMLDFETFKARHRDVAQGDYYGIDFPFTMAMFPEFGAAFLTAAFRAAGTIAVDNAVTEVVALDSLGKMGASENAFLTVRYARAEAGLSEKLFAKFPPLEEGYKYGLSRMAQGEIAMHHFSGRGSLPVPVAKTYFGDYSSHTTNYILITDRIPFGVEPIERAYLKGWDHLMPEVEDHYRVLARSLGTLAGTHKAGKLGDDVEEVFPFARAARDFAPISDVPARVAQLVDFIARVAPQLFVTGGSDPAFLQQLEEDLVFGLTHKDDVIAYLHSDVDYVSLCHPNLNPDNAWFWRDANGQLQAGLLDWGGAGQMSVAQAMSGMLMMVEPERHLDIVRMALDTFIGAYTSHGGPQLDIGELRLQYKASLFSTALGLIVGLILDLLPQFSEEEYRSMENRFDQRLLDNGLYAAIVWIDDMLREWQDDLTPGQACREIVARRAALAQKG